LDIVATRAEAEASGQTPLLILADLAAYLDRERLGAGPLEARPLGDGHSNATFLLSRGETRLVLRRPPRPPLPPTAHDVLREARIMSALHAAGIRVPRVIRTCDDPSWIGAPFVLLEPIDAVVITQRLPASISRPADRRRLGRDVIDALVEIHRVDYQAAGLSGIGRGAGYLARQVQRFSALWPVNKTRELPSVERAALLLARRVPPESAVTVVHGDYRLGNLMIGRERPARVEAIVDWELATLGDPLADLGYLCATWSEPDTTPLVIELSPVTAQAGFPTRAELAAWYEESTRRSAGDQAFYRALALFKAAVFCEAIYGRYLRGETAQPFAAALGQGVPVLAEEAVRLLASPSTDA
jgi:aminoglycoside phosphotransferase (APT) family kinase protein